MALHYLGEQIDIHGGGQDLIFPHHENEIAQSESFTGKKPFVRYWMHNGLLRLGEEKMSKSIGNIVSISEILSKYSADALRLFVLSSHYRSPLTFTMEALDAAERGAGRLRQAALPVSGGRPVVDADLGDFRQRFKEAMDDDFNSPQAIAVLFDLVRDLNRMRDEGYDVGPSQAVFRELSGILGLTLKSRETADNAEQFISLLVDIRRELREAKQYRLADVIRERLQALGIALEDDAEGTKWKVRPS